MGEFENLITQGKFIDEGIQGLENIISSRSMNMYPIGDTDQFIQSLDENVSHFADDLKELKEKKRAISGLNQLINDTEKCIDDLVKFGPLINLQFPGQTTTQMYTRIATKQTPTPISTVRERQRTPVQSPKTTNTTPKAKSTYKSPKMAIFSGQPRFREITHEEFDQCDRITRLSIHLDDLNNAYRQLYNSGTPQFTEEAAMKITKMFSSKSRAFWSVLLKYGRVQETVENGAKAYMFI